VEELARILDEDGYLADFQAQPDGTYLITDRLIFLHRVGRFEVRQDAVRKVIARLEMGVPQGRGHI
jgi:hypothetical protein